MLGWAPKSVRTSDVYLVEGDLSAAELEQIAAELLNDPVIQEARLGVSPPANHARLIEVHPLPGVMDPIAQSAEMLIRELLGRDSIVSTGVRYDIDGATEPALLDEFAARVLSNPVVHAVYTEPFVPDELPHGHAYELQTQEIPLLDLDESGLQRLSREGHLFLSLQEMQAIQAEYRRLGREPRDIELETLAQTWSEHCVHKTLKATIRFEGDLPPTPDGERPGHVRNEDGTTTIHNLLKRTVAAATNEIIADGADWLLSVFVDNAGVIAFDEDTAVCFKVETHNHPSAIEPYGGAATGIGGCIRDIIGTGLAAKPIASTDVFCVAYPDHFAIEPGEAASRLPTGCLHPRRILTQVVAGVRDYGNRMGIPTLNGAVWFDDRYVGNPLVFCGCVGVMPRDKVAGEPRAGDRIIALGGRTGRDGIHGATFSSAELTDTHADEFSHAVQIGNAITEKKTLDVILQARDHESGCLFNAITDCGAGGFSSAVGEMGEKLGAVVNLDRALLKYAGLSYTEIWISEAQERMVLAVPEDRVDELVRLCEIEQVEWCDLGEFGAPDRELILNYGETEVGRLSMEFLHEGIPTPTREARWTPAVTDAEQPSTAATPSDIESTLLELLAHPNIASKEWIIRQYDHEVQGRTLVKPIVGIGAGGPSDAAVITPKRNSNRGLAIANGLSTGLAGDPYGMALASIDECVRNLVCVGAEPDRIAILDNFCWPSCEKPENLGSLVLAAEGCYDAAKAYRTPFISGKDSLNNQFTTDDGETIEIPPTLLISGFGIVPDVRRCVTMDAKSAGDLLVIVGVTGGEMGGSMARGPHSGRAPRVDLMWGPRAARAVAHLIREGFVRAAHDCSEGGLLVAAAEMAFAGGIGLELDLAELPVDGEVDLFERLFAETPSRYLLEITTSRIDEVRAELGDLPHAILGHFNDSHTLSVPSARMTIKLETLRQTWDGRLQW